MRIFNDIVSRLQTVYDASEARALARMLVEEVFGLSFTDVCLGALEKLQQTDQELLQVMVRRMCDGEPIQYVLGEAWFCGRKMDVEKGVLIPRPETELLVEWIKEMMSTGDKVDVRARKLLDIGTGSGCIAVTLACELENAEVTAWDVSDTALKVTRQNARKHGANVDACMQDALSAPSNDKEMWDVIVSNPPYICVKEAAEMTSNVLDYEPHEALFVPDEDPLLFYKAIAQYASHALRRGGLLFFEINEAYGPQTIAMLESHGYANVMLRKDQFGKERMVCASTK